VLEAEGELLGGGVDEAVAEGLEEGIGRVVGAHHKLPHRIYYYHYHYHIMYIYIYIK
jgi:hypothetical protein